MHLKILLPSEVFADEYQVSAITIGTPEGEFGILELRLDCMAILSPGILSYQSFNQGQVYVAIDAGILIKADQDVLVSVRRALTGVPLNELHEAIIKQYLTLDELEQDMRMVLAKLNSNFIHTFTDYKRP